MLTSSPRLAKPAFTGAIFDAAPSAAPSPAGHHPCRSMPAIAAAPSFATSSRRLSATLLSARSPLPPSQASHQFTITVALAAALALAAGALAASILAASTPPTAALAAASSPLPLVAAFATAAALTASLSNIDARRAAEHHTYEAEVFSALPCAVAPVFTALYIM